MGYSGYYLGRRRLLFLSLVASLIGISSVYALYLSPLISQYSELKVQEDTILIGFENGTRRTIDLSTPEGERLLSECEIALFHVTDMYRCIISGRRLSKIESTSAHVKVVFHDIKNLNLHLSAPSVQYQINTTALVFILSGEYENYLFILRGSPVKYQDTSWNVFGIENINQWIHPPS